jgi:hypothetical protein
MDSNSLHPWDETVWRRGWNDAKRGWLDWRFLLADVVLFPVVALLLDAYVAVAVSAGALVAVVVGTTAAAPIKQRNEARAALLKSSKTPAANVTTNIELSSNGMAVLVNLRNASDSIDHEYEAVLEAYGLRVETLDGLVLLEGPVRVSPPIALDVYGTPVSFTLFTKQIRANGSEAMTNDIMKPGGSKDEDYWREPCRVSVRLMGRNLDKTVSFQLKNVKGGPFDVSKIV